MSVQTYKHFYFYTNKPCFSGQDLFWWSALWWTLRKVLLWYLGSSFDDQQLELMVRSCCNDQNIIVVVRILSWWSGCCLAVKILTWWSRLSFDNQLSYCDGKGLVVIVRILLWWPKPWHRILVIVKLFDQGWSGSCFNGQDIAVMIRILFCWSGSCCDDKLSYCSGQDVVVTIKILLRCSEYFNGHLAHSNNQYLSAMDKVLLRRSGSFFNGWDDCCDSENIIVVVKIFSWWSGTCCDDYYFVLVFTILFWWSIYCFIVRWFFGFITLLCFLFSISFYDQDLFVKISILLWWLLPCYGGQVLLLMIEILFYEYRSVPCCDDQYLAMVVSTCYCGQYFVVVVSTLLWWRDAGRSPDKYHCSRNSLLPRSNSDISVPPSGTLQ